jgi:glycosyltransferase involved in cell wall biosynthesis
MAAADCLVLPSRHDGWGAVVSEALMAGTPAICSYACGAAGAVRSSGVGGVFATGDVAALTQLLARVIAEGARSPEQRSQLVAWAHCLGTEAGASYLNAILAAAEGAGVVPTAPWQPGSPYSASEGER